MKYFVSVRRIAPLLALAVGVGLLFLAWDLRPLHVHDDFEGSTLSGLWSHHRFEAGAVQVQHLVARAGQQSLRITVHAGDRLEKASDDGVASERAEVAESWWLWSHLGRTYVYAFSLFLPTELPVTDERVVVAQWKQLCFSFRCRPDNPILAIRYASGGIEVTTNDERGKHVVYSQGSDLRGQWLDFRFKVRWDAHEGSIEGTLNGRNIVLVRGQTAYERVPGYPTHGLVYSKSGLYRDARNQPPWTIFLDEFRKDECRDGVCE
jgi:hypothetical protein